MVELDAQVDVGELPVVQADRTQMRQLLQNLIGNALKFHRDDAVAGRFGPSARSSAIRPRGSPASRLLPVAA